MLTKPSNRVTVWFSPLARPGERWVVTHTYGSLVDHHRFRTRREARAAARELRKSN